MNSTRAKRTLLAALWLTSSVAAAPRPTKKDAPAARPSAKKLNVPHDRFSKDCAQCHEAKRWDVLKPGFRFNHAKETGVALQGAHVKLGCSRCHNDRIDTHHARARGCVLCHQDAHRGSLGTDCARCHGPFTWTPDNMVVQHARTRFPLTGAHQAAACNRCHPRADAQDFRGAGTDCYGCHAADYASAPNHSAGNFDRRCSNCHGVSTWAGARIDHARMSPATDCYGCHAADYARGPNHVAQGYVHTCMPCHNTATWVTSGKPDHSRYSTSTDCSTCHAADYARAPNHAAQNYARTCLQCHNTNTWVSARIDHAVFNAGTNCNQCHAADFQRGPNHVAGGYPTLCGGCHTSYVSWGPGTPMNHGTLGGRTDCVTCHMTDYQSALNHSARSYPTACTQCHSGYSTWVGASFRHAALGGRTDCQTCHMAKYQSAQNPNHVSMGFPTTCYNCHRDTNDWRNATLTHNRFPSDHHHASCLQCHTSGSSTSFNCLVCHRKAEMDDKHKEAGSGYSWSNSTCLNCHLGGVVPPH
jgi:predicted CXXCH cytochrome family protein